MQTFSATVKTCAMPTTSYIKVLFSHFLLPNSVFSGWLQVQVFVSLPPVEHSWIEFLASGVGICSLLATVGIWREKKGI